MTEPPRPLEVLRALDGEAPHLVGSRCRACGRASFPARVVCGGCGAEASEETPLGRRGRITASAVVYHAPIGFEAPYVVALVELEEGPIVFCPLAGCPPDEARVPPGTAVELAVGPARPGGAPVIRFRPSRP